MYANLRENLKIYIYHKPSIISNSNPSDPRLMMKFGILMISGFQRVQNRQIQMDISCINL